LLLEGGLTEAIDVALQPRLLLLNLIVDRVLACKRRLLRRDLVLPGQSACDCAEEARGTEYQDENVNSTSSSNA
jgi:hypothetical protein